MSEREWLACDDPNALLARLPTTSSDRKLRLAAIAAYRWSIVPLIGTPWAARSVYSLSDELLERAEALAEGRVSYDEAQRGRLGTDGESVGLIAENPVTGLETALRGAEVIVDRYADLLLVYCSGRAWPIATSAAWGYLRDTLKDDPWLTGEDRIRDDFTQQRERLQDQAWEHLLRIRRRNGSIDYWNYARTHFAAAITRTAAWDAVWEETWVREWRQCWADVCPPGSERLQQEYAEEWKSFSDMVRSEAWNVGPWDEDPPPARDFEVFAGYSELSWVVKDFIRVAEPGRQAAMLRDIFGNPFRPALLDPSWRTETVVALARGIYEERAFDRLPILADALQESGCDNADLLDHCRGPSSHVPGCWVVDLLLGKV